MRGKNLLTMTFILFLILTSVVLADQDKKELKTQIENKQSNGINDDLTIEAAARIANDSYLQSQIDSFLDLFVQYTFFNNTISLMWNKINAIDAKVDSCCNNCINQADIAELNARISALELKLNQTSTYQSLINLTSGLVAYYPFNGNANDVSGMGNNGLVFGATLTADSIGNINSAYYFNSMDNHIIVSNSPSLIVGTQMALSWQMNLSQWGTIMQKTTTDYSDGWIVWGSHLGELRFYVNSGTYCASWPVTTNDKFHSYIINYNNTPELYQDGILITPTVNTCSGELDSNQDLWIGESSSGSNDVKAVIDDIRIYNRVLSSEEIAQLTVSQ